MAGDVDLSGLAAGGEREDEEEPTVDEITEAAARLRAAGVDLSGLAAKPRREGVPRIQEIEVDVEGVEDQLEATVQLLQAIQNQTASINTIANLVGVLTELARSETDPWAVAQFPADIRDTVPTETEVRETQAISADVFHQATVFFPNTQHLVDFRLQIDGDRVIPDADVDAAWVSLDDTEQVFDINAAPGEQVDVRATWRNRDSVNPHRVPCTLEYTEA